MQDGADSANLPSRDLTDRIARTWAADLSLQLDRERLAFLSGIHAYLELNPDTVLGEAELRDVFSLLNDVVQGDQASLALRGTHAIDSLCRQHLLVRADLGGIAAEGEFTLSPLGKTLAEWFSAHETLTRESLEVMLTRVRGDLAVVRAAAAAGGDDRHWRTQVVAPLKLTVAGLVKMIDRRQRGMDVQQQETRERIGHLLEVRWLDAVDQCEALLQDTSATLHELNRTLMSETEGVSNLLNEIYDAADAARRDEALDAVSHVRTQIERVAAWGDSRFQSWSAYYQNVHELIPRRAGPGARWAPVWSCRTWSSSARNGKEPAMDEPGFRCLEDVMTDLLFPSLDHRLRKGFHVDSDDIAEYELQERAAEWLETFYAGYECRLVHGSEGYWYLLSEGDLLDYRQYLDLTVQVQRLGSELWTEARAGALSTGESIGVGAARC